MDHSFGAKLNSLQLTPLRKCDLECLRQWRNDRNISRFFREIPNIDYHHQISWYQEYLLLPNCYYWAIIENKKTIGALSIYNIFNGNAEIGKIMIGDSLARGKSYGYYSMIMSMKIGFDYLKVQSYILNVHEKNIPALKTYDRIGFHIVGSHQFDIEGCEYEMYIDKGIFDKENPISKDIIIYDYSMSEKK